MKRILFAVLMSGALMLGTARAANPVVEMVTSKGTIKIELYPKKAPITVKNFLQYVKDGFYDGTIFHRVIPGFMIQGGGFKPGMKKKKTRDPIKLEVNVGLSNTTGTIAMARTPNPNSATAQFFINVSDNSDSLDPNAMSAGYAVFGKVIEGLKVAKEIVSVPRGNFNGYQDVPKTDVIIRKVRLKM